MEVENRKTQNPVFLYITAVFAFSIEAYACYYYAFFKGYSSTFEANIKETIGASLFLLVPYIFVLVRAKSKNSIIAGGFVNILLAGIAAFVFYNSLVLNYHISTASYAFALVPLYQALFIFIFFMGTRKNA
jgi:hypothetical protein